MRLWDIRAASACLVFAAVFAVASVSFAQFLAPGPLSQPHAKLEGDDNCQACHSVGKGVSNDKCTSCHDAIGKAQAAGRGLHGRNFKGQPCFKCHSDHHGRNFSLIRWDPKALNHADTGFALRGAHAAKECASCHKTKSYLGLSSECTACHQDPHETRFGAACLGCHNEVTWKQVDLTGFDHRRARFPLRGGHARVDCAACHQKQGAPAKYKGLAFDACTNCHQDPHRGRFGAGCENCHTEEKWQGVVLKPGAHPWLSLANGHSRVACRACHDRGWSAPPSRGRACVSCHPAVHEAKFGNQCQSCHDSIRWLGLPRPVGIAAHLKTVYPLKGKHEAAACTGCHQPKLARNERFRALKFDRCLDCHADIHEARFKDRDGGECGLCHQETGFRPSHFGVALHASTRFPLVGRHVAVACGKCHDQEPPGARRLDWQLAKTACAECHQNPHGEQFAREMRKNGCATCHTPVDWNIPNIDHASWPLTGVHAQTRCDACHSPTDADKKLGRGPSYQAAPRECEGCHADVHLGQFRLKSPVRSCDACHTTMAFKIPDFDHAKVTGYVLDGKHAPLVCNKCHTEEALHSGRRAVRFRLGYRKCRDCHADPHAGGSP